MKNKSLRDGIEAWIKKWAWHLTMEGEDRNKAIDELLKAVVAMAKRARPDGKRKNWFNPDMGTKDWYLEALDDYLKAIEEECI